jgi:hypothetical protein
VPISHAAIAGALLAVHPSGPPWNWKEKFAVNWQVWVGALPERIVVDETLVKVGGRKCWIFAAIDPATRRVLYLRAFRERGLWQTCQFFQELRRLYGRWAAEAIVDGGPWYQGALWRLGRTKRVRMVDGIRNYVERFFRELKQGLKPFDVSLPQRRLGLTSLSAPLAGAVCLALQPVPHGKEVICLILTASLDIKPSSGITPLGLQYPISSHFLNTN